MRKINKRQLKTLESLIHAHIHTILSDKEKANSIFQVIKGFGVNTMPQAIDLYRYNSVRLNKGAHIYTHPRKAQQI